MVDEKIVFSLRLRSPWSKRSVDGVVALPVDIVAARQTDVVNAELDPQADIAIIDNPLRHAVQGVPVGMRAKLKTFVRKGR
jgi:hypothetical protein